MISFGLSIHKPSLKKYPLSHKAQILNPEYYKQFSILENKQLSSARTCLL